MQKKRTATSKVYLCPVQISKNATTPKQASKAWFELQSRGFGNPSSHESDAREYLKAVGEEIYSTLSHPPTSEPELTICNLYGKWYLCNPNPNVCVFINCSKIWPAERTTKSTTLILCLQQESRNLSPLIQIGLREEPNVHLRTTIMELVKYTGCPTKKP